MMGNTGYLILAGVLLTSAAACNREEPETTAATADREAPQQQARDRDDSAVTTSVQAKYYGSDEVRGRNISVVSRDGVVTLRGTVDSEEAKQRAVSLAREVEGVQQVVDELRVETTTADNTTARPVAPGTEQPAGTSGRNTDPQPGWITTKIQAQYFVNPEVKPWNIDVTTNNDGIVTLEGEVDATEDKSEAVRIARETEGVVRVEDRLRVKGETEAREAETGAGNLERPDAWLTAKIQSKYFLDEEVKGHEINVDTVKGVVTLNGVVRNQAQRRQAIALARNTEGVRDVVDRLKVDPRHADRDDTARRRLERVQDLERPDEWITMKIQAKYFLEPDVKGRKIDVDTAKGVVTLQGSVGSAAEKQQAERIASETEGVTRVVNQLTVGSQRR